MLSCSLRSNKISNVLLNTVAVLGWGQGGTGPPNLAQAPQIFDWFRTALFLLEGF